MTSLREEPAESGKGLVLTGLIVGLIAGFAAYGVIEFWIDDADDKPLPIAVLGFILTAAGGYLLMAELDQLGRSMVAAGAIAAILFVPDFFMANAASHEVSDVPPHTIFWFLAGRWITVFLMLTLVKAGLEADAPPPYPRVFFHGLTLPLIGAGAKLFAVLALLLLFAWARLLKELDVDFFNKLFQEPWFLFPFLGGVGGASIALMRGQQSVLGALRFVLLLLSRLLMLITALFTVTLLIVLATKGIEPVFDRPYPSVWMMTLALLGMLIFNGVYQNGDAGAPPVWLRLPTLITLIGFPVYAGLAFYGFYVRIDDYGLTPPRILGLAINGLTAAYSLVCLAGLASELNWRARRWMAPVGSLNIVMALLWIAALMALATPIADPLAISARSQVQRLAQERVDAADFDYGYLRFRLGDHGEQALSRLEAMTDHPQAERIREGVAAARAANSYWEYQNPEAFAPVPADPIGPSSGTQGDSPMTLELNPEGADTGDDAPEPAEPEDN